MFTQARAYLIAQREQPCKDLLPADEVVRKRDAVADALGLIRCIRRAHEARVDAGGVFPDGFAAAAEEGFHLLPARAGDRADGVDAHSGEPFRGRAADKHHIPRGERPENRLIVFARDAGGCVRLFIIAAQLCEDFVERNADGDRDANLLSDSSAQLVCNLLSGTKLVLRARDVQPRLVDAERLHKVGILPVDLVDLVGNLLVEIVMRHDERELRALLLRLPNGLRGLYAVLLCEFVFREDDAVPALRVAADRHRHEFQLRSRDTLDRSEIRVAVTMQYRAIHSRLSVCPKRVLRLRRSLFIYYSAFTARREKIARTRIGYKIFMICFT